VGRLVDRLEARGLIERRPDPSDRRVRRLHLLPAAQPMLTKIEAYKDEMMDWLIGELEPKSIETLVHVLTHMKTKLVLEAAAGKVAAAGG
jgi:DNA-binding MarR family transcriptional regulator